MNKSKKIDFVKKMTDDMLPIIRKRVDNAFAFDDDHAEACYDYILDRIYERTKKWKQTAPFDHFFNVVLQNLIIDFRDKIFQSRKIPQPIQNKGFIYEEVYKKIFRDKLTDVETEIEMLKIVKEAIKFIREKYSPKVKNIHTPFDEKIIGEDPFKDLDKINEKQSFLYALEYLLFNVNFDKNKALKQFKINFKKTLQFEDDEILFLKQIYIENFNIYKAGENLKWFIDIKNKSKRHQEIYSKHKNLLERILNALEKSMTQEVIDTINDLYK